MNLNYSCYPEIVLINRRITKTRFRRNMIVFCGVDNEGKTIVLGVAFLKDDNIKDFQFAIKSFLSTRTDPPGCFSVERNSQLRDCLQKDWPEMKLLYCTQALHKSLKSQFKLISSKESFSDKTLKLLNKIQRLPTIENHSILWDELNLCRK